MGVESICASILDLAPTGSALGLLNDILPLDGSLLNRDASVATSKIYPELESLLLSPIYALDLHSCSWGLCAKYLLSQIAHRRNLAVPACCLTSNDHV